MDAATLSMFHRDSYLMPFVTFPMQKLRYA